MDQVQRKAVIDGQKAAPGRRHRFAYRNRTEDLPVVRVPLELPIYRMGNTRTEVEQLEYVQANRLPENFFSAGEENQSVQQAQHEILLRMSKDETGPIYLELEVRREQTEPLLITAYGVVVNGNRRLAAMRDLYASDSKAYKAFGHVDAMVLPETADAIDLEIIETELQMVPETKLEYGWVEQRLKLRHFRDDRQFTPEQIRELMRFRKADEANRRIQELELAEEYLGMYVRKPRAYKLVEKSEQIFHELADRLEKKTGEDAELARHIGFLLIKESDNLGTRVYELREAFGKYSPAVVQRLAEDLGIEPVVVSEAGTPQPGAASDDPLSGLPTGSVTYPEEMRSILADPSRASDLAAKVVEIHRDLKAAEKNAGVRGAALASVERAHRLLQEVDLTASDSDKLDAIVAQLESILGVAEQLRNKAAIQIKSLAKGKKS